MTDMARRARPPGWYNDPTVRDGLRWWDGEAWAAQAPPRPAPRHQLVTPDQTDAEADTLPRAARRAGHLELASAATATTIEALPTAVPAGVSAPEPARRRVVIPAAESAGAAPTVPVPGSAEADTSTSVPTVELAAAVPAAAPVGAISAAAAAAPARAVPPNPEPARPTSVEPRPTASTRSQTHVPASATGSMAPPRAAPSERIAPPVIPPPFPRQLPPVTAESAQPTVQTMPMPYVPARPTPTETPREQAPSVVVAEQASWRALLLPRRATTPAAWVLAFAPEGVTATLLLADLAERFISRVPFAGIGVVAISMLITLLLATSDRRRMTEFGWDSVMPLPAILATPLPYLVVRQLRIARAGGRYLALLLAVLANSVLVGAVALAMGLSGFDWVHTVLLRLFSA